MTVPSARGIHRSSQVTRCSSTEVATSARKTAMSTIFTCRIPKTTIPTAAMRTRNRHA